MEPNDQRSGTAELHATEGSVYISLSYFGGGCRWSTGVVEQRSDNPRQPGRITRAGWRAWIVKLQGIAPAWPPGPIAQTPSESAAGGSSGEDAPTSRLLVYAVCGVGPDQNNRCCRQSNASWLRSPDRTSWTPCWGHDRSVFTSPLVVRSGLGNAAAAPCSHDMALCAGRSSSYSVPISRHFR